MGTGVSASYGFTGTLNYAQFAALANPDPFTGTECKASAGTGTRQAVVASGVARVHHTLHTVSGATLSLAENTSGLTRVDLVCLLVDWTADSGAGDASLVAITGTPSASPSAPYGSLSTTPGTAWHEPIAEVTVASGAGVLAGSAIKDIRTGPWVLWTPRTPWTNYGSGLQNLGGRRTADGTVTLGGIVKTTSGLGFPYGGPIITLPARWQLAVRTPFLVYAVHTTAAVPERVDVQAYVEPTYPTQTAASSTRHYNLNQITYTTLQANT